MDQLLFTGNGRTGTGGVLGHGLLHGTDGWKEGRRHGMISCGMVGLGEYLETTYWRYGPADCYRHRYFEILSSF